MRPGLWVLVVACIALSVGYGVRQSLGLFIGPMSADRGWTTSVFALAFALQNLSWGIFQPFVGAFADRWGARITVAVGGLSYAAAIALMALTHSPVVFAWAGGVLLGLGLAATSYGVLIGPAAAVVPPEQRSLAFGILGAGGSLGQSFYPPLAQFAIGGIGWYPTLMILAAIGIAIVPLALVLKAGLAAQHAAPLSLRAALREAFAVPSYGFLTLGFFVCGFHIAFFQTHLPNIVAKAGFAPAVGATALSIVGIFNVIGSFGSGKLAQRFPKRYILAAIYSLRAAIIVIFVMVPMTPFTIVAFSAALGVLWLSTVPPTTGIIAEKFGLQWVSMLFGFAFLSHQIGAFLGAWLGAVIYERTGTYDLMWGISIALGIASALVNLPIDERPVERVAAPIPVRA